MNWNENLTIKLTIKLLQIRIIYFTIPLETWRKIQMMESY